VLGTICDKFGGAEVGDRLDGGSGPAGEINRQGRRDRAARGQRFERDSQPVVQGGRVDAARDVTQVG